MRILLFWAVIIGGLVLLETGCTKASADKLAGTCDTTSVSYARDIVPILRAYCYECHGAGNTAGSNGTLLEGYDNLKGWALNGYLVGNVTHAPGFIGMPYQRPMLSSCDINKITAWVHQGEPQ